ncbi:hypothetical protein KY339_01860, partial [Candidatus Woesearchaeota archaeon]|nr:hypothetical protein [Candidatus Woesearchaeota archaeon]
MYRERAKKSSNFAILASSKIFSDKDFKQLRVLIEKLKAKHKESANRLINRIETVPIIPLSIFNEKLSTLEAIAKYTKENLGLSHAKTAKFLNRSQKTIWQAHYHAKKKFPKKFIVTDSRFNIPITIFSNRILSTLESIVFYLKEKYNLRNSEIAKLLKRDSSTVWTVYSRAKKKCSIKKISITDLEKETPAKTK